MPDKASAPLLAQLAATLEKDAEQRQELIGKIKARIAAVCAEFCKQGGLARSTQPCLHQLHCRASCCL